LRFVHQPEQPRKPAAPHPLGGSPKGAGGVGDCRTAADEPGSRQREGEQVDQFFLFREAEPHEDDVGGSGREPGADRIEDGGVVVEAEGRCVGADDRQIWVPAPQPGRSAVRDLVVTPQQVNRSSVLGSRLAEREDERAARHPLGQWMPAETGRPDQWHSVGHGQGRGLDQAPQLRIAPRVAADVDVGCDHPSAFSGQAGVDDVLYRLTLGQGVKVQAGQLDPLVQRLHVSRRPSR
jgi:hypothetical protein